MSEADSTPPVVHENRSRNDGVRDTLAPAERREYTASLARAFIADIRAGADVEKLRASLADARQATRDALDEAIVRASKPKRWAECDDEEKLKRVADVEALARMHGIECTGPSGPPEVARCTNPGAMAFILTGRLFAVPCVDHAGEIAAYIIRQGYGAFRQIPLAEMLDEHGEKFISSARHIRDTYRERGWQLNPGRYYSRKGV